MKKIFYKPSQDTLNPANLPISKPYLNAMWMSPTVGEYVLDGSLCKLPRALMLLQYNAYLNTGLDIATLFTVLTQCDARK